MKEIDPLLREVLANDELTEFRRDSLASGLAAIRRKRRQRQVWRASAALAGSIALVWIGSTHWRPSSTNAPRVASQPSIAPIAPARSNEAQPTPTPMKILTNQELAALFPDRPTAFIGKPGHQRFVFLDGKPPRRTINE